ncbi:MAG: C45 family peptidase [Candidatus Roizmanbacteria bacterium]|nr:C45 family peptidase [Candidatus Roizmanbacteria bacterium]
MKHNNYFQVIAKNNFDLGIQLGTNFKRELMLSLNKQRKNDNWGIRVDKSKVYLEVTEKHFPSYIDELKGYAKGSGVDFRELWALRMLWALNIEDDRCTTLVTNGGFLVSHNEDWEVGTKDTISVLKKTVGKLTIFELYYPNTLGGCAVSVNSHGFFQGINTLTHSGSQVGIPRNIIARFLSETNNPEKDFRKLKALTRQFGYSHVIVNSEGKTWNVESTGSDALLVKPELPFVHTNHFLTDLKSFDKDDNSCGTHDRYTFAKRYAKPNMKRNELEKLVSDTSKGKKVSLFNERTIGRMIVDFKERVAKVWLLREKEKGWVDYELDFLNL